MRSASDASTAPVPSTGRYLVGDIAIDTRQRKVLRPDGDVELTQRVFDLLVALVSEPDTLHTREALLERVWGTTCIEDSNLTQSISVIRRALGEDRKGWIRTVSKRGYSFEPPGEVIHLPPERSVPTHSPNPPLAHVTVDAPIDRHALPVAMPAPHAASASIRALRWAAALLLGLSLLVSGSRAQPDATTALAVRPRAAIGIVLVDATSGAADAPSRQAASMLKAWLRWKLELLPEAVLIREDELLAAHALDTWFVEIRAEPRTAHRHSTLQVSLRRLQRDGRDGRDAAPAIVGTLRGRDPVTTVDALSRQAMAGLFPRRRSERWPALALDAATALHFAQGTEALDRRAYATARVMLGKVVESAPGFGPARLALARTLADDGRVRQGAEQAALAQGLLAPLPPGAAYVVAAEIAALTPTRSVASIDAYARLSTANPDRGGFALAQAQALMRANRPEDALRLLGAAQWERQPLALRIRQRTARAEAALALGYHDLARESAAEAIGLVGLHVDGHARELGQAQLVFARTRHQQYRQGTEPALYHRAIRTFEADGNRLGALTAAYFEAAAENDVAEAERRLAALLEVAGQHGDHASQVRALRSMAFVHAESGDHAAARRTRHRALDIAAMAGDIATQQLLQLDMVDDDLEAGDLDAAGRRLAALRQNRLSMKYRLRVARKESALLRLRGRYRDALDHLDARLSGEARNAAWQAAPIEAARIACMRTQTLSAMGDLAMARSQLRGCHDPGSSSIPVVAHLGEAEIALHDGNLLAARRLLDDADRRLSQRRMDGGKIELGTALAMLRLRTGEHARAEALYRILLPAARQQGQALPLAEIEIGLAELAAVRRDWTLAQRYAAQARQRLPQGIWPLDSRLQLIDIARRRAYGDVEGTRAQAATLAQRAEARGDAVVRAQAMALMPSTTRPDIAAGQIARTTTTHAIDWLIAADARMEVSLVAVQTRDPR
ncbi:winged helix-turn-helix domain-containing protein [Lysobacter brunescens]|uniref:Winged helix-turn-helix domain-containing protein n=1 Tax=Lysobacter brunescens TaxID=262323 RepID=A0ABW2YEN0_9GAMM